MRIDEPRRHDEPPGVDDRLPGFWRELTDGGNMIAFHPDVGDPWLRAGTIHQSAVSDQIRIGENRRTQKDRQYYQRDTNNKGRARVVPAPCWAGVPPPAG